MRNGVRRYVWEFRASFSAREYWENQYPNSQMELPLLILLYHNMLVIVDGLKKIDKKPSQILKLNQNIYFLNLIFYKMKYGPYLNPWVNYLKTQKNSNMFSCMAYLKSKWLYSCHFSYFSLLCNHIILNHFLKIFFEKSSKLKKIHFQKI